jgi:hypothetical protein
LSTNSANFHPGPPQRAWLVRQGGLKILRANS